MPVATTYPGVYIEEIPSGVHTITGVATSIAAFLGQAKEGPVNRAIRILSYADFQRTFGPPHPDSELDTAVRLFFQNGGTDCYVVRLVKKGTGNKASAVSGTAFFPSVSSSEDCKGAIGSYKAWVAKCNTSTPCPTCFLSSCSVAFFPVKGDDP